MAGTSYQDAPVCVECGNTPLFTKWAAKLMTTGSFRSFYSGYIRCPYRNGWHVLLSLGDGKSPLPAPHRP